MLNSKLRELRNCVNEIFNSKDVKQDLNKLLVYLLKQRDVLLEAAMREWIEFVDRENTETIIISLGSGHAPEQQLPNFSKSFHSKIAILNVDEAFIEKEGVTKNNISIEYMPSIIDLKETPKSYQILKNGINSWLHSGKKVILINSIDPNAYSYFIDIIQSNLRYLDNTFCYIASYHEKQPVLVLLKNFFENIDINCKKIKEFKKDIWQRMKPFSQKELESLLSEKYPDLKFLNAYPNISAIEYENLFPKFQQENRSNKHPVIYQLDTKQVFFNNNVNNRNQQPEKLSLTDCKMFAEIVTALKKLDPEKYSSIDDLFLLPANNNFHDDWTRYSFPESRWCIIRDFGLQLQANGFSKPFNDLETIIDFSSTSMTNFNNFHK